jgi:phage terminase small subunit
MSGNVAGKDMVSAKGVKLTPKQKAFADTLINNPKLSGTQAALQTYGTPDKQPTYQSAREIAHTNMTKTNIQIYMDKHVDKAKQTIVNLLNSEKDDIKLRAADSILDRQLGKSTQRIDQTTSVTLVQPILNSQSVQQVQLDQPTE